MISMRSTMALLAGQLMLAGCGGSFINRGLHDQARWLQGQVATSPTSASEAPEGERQNYESRFEVQVSPLWNLLHQCDKLKRESRASFKATRDRARDEVAQRFPRFGFYRALLRWLFLDPSGAAAAGGRGTRARRLNDRPPCRRP